MVARGYNGQLPIDSPLRPKERFAVLLACAIAATRNPNFLQNLTQSSLRNIEFVNLEIFNI